MLTKAMEYITIQSRRWKRMEKKKGIVLFKDKEFADIFIKSIERAGSRYILKNGYDADEDAGFVIASRNMQKQAESFSKKGKKIIYISEKEDDDIYLYQGAKHITGEIVLALEDQEDFTVTEKDLLSIGVISFSGGAGVTTVSTAAAAILSRVYGQKPLIFSLAAINRGNFLTNKYIGSDPDFRQFLYSLYIKRKMPLECLTSEKDGISYIKVPFVNTGISRFDVEMEKQLIKNAGESGFTHLFIDIGNLLTEKNIELLSELELVIVVLDKNDFPGRGIPPKEKLYSLVGKIAGETVKEKTFFVLNRSGSQRQDLFNISDAGRMSPSALDGTFADGIVQLVREAVVI